MKLKIKTDLALPLISAVLTSAVLGGYAMVFGGRAVSDEGDERDALSVGDRGSDVAALQEKLKLYGYYDGEVDGVYDLATSEAVRHFKLDEGRAELGDDFSGDADGYDMYALGVYADESVREMRLGDEGIGVLRLQRELRRMGYYSGEISGRYGLMTASAVRSWQGEHGMRVTGVCDVGMIEAMELVGGGAEIRDGDVRLMVLARFVESVGRGLDHRGQVEVAAEVLRRYEASGGRSLYAVGAEMAREMGASGLSETASAESRRAALDAVMGMMG